MKKMDPCSTTDHSHKNTRWIYVSTKSHINCDKVLRNLGNRKKWRCYGRPNVFNPNCRKVRILTMSTTRNKLSKVNMIIVYFPILVNNFYPIFPIEAVHHHLFPYLFIVTIFPIPCNNCPHDPIP